MADCGLRAFEVSFFSRSSFSSFLLSFASILSASLFDPNLQPASPLSELDPESFGSRSDADSDSDPVLCLLVVRWRRRAYVVVYALVLFSCDLRMVLGGYAGRSLLAAVWKTRFCKGALLDVESGGNVFPVFGNGFAAGLMVSPRDSH